MNIIGEKGKERSGSKGGGDLIRGWTEEAAVLKKSFQTVRSGILGRKSATKGPIKAEKSFFTKECSHRIALLSMYSISAHSSKEKMPEEGGKRLD